MAAAPADPASGASLARGGAALAVILLALGVVGTAWATGERPTLAELETEIICPTCRTTLDQSSSPIADRMRAFIRARIAAGDSKSEIKRRLVAQFGEQVLASPPRRGFNLLAWVLPPVGAVLAAALLGVLAWRWSRKRAGDGRDGEHSQAGGGLDPELERRLEEELRRFEV